MKFTFGIITSGTSDENLSLCIQSIHELKIPYYEIIVVGNTSIIDDRVKVIRFDESVKEKWITRKKNIITEFANFENIVYCHDYILFDSNWYDGFLKYGDNFKICMNQILNKDGSRFRDWCIWIWNYNFMDQIVGPKKECLIPYDMIHLSKYMYFSGAYWVAKKNVMVEFPLDERLCWGEGEDVLWSRQIRERYNFSMNKYSTVRLLKQQEVAFNVATENTILKLNRIKLNHMKLTELLNEFNLNGDFLNTGYSIGGTDKNTYHSYIENFYEVEFESYREKNIDLLEIGIETGGSLKLWKEYFCNSKSIVGIDITDEKIDSQYKEISGVNMCFGDAYDIDFSNNFGDFDIIIDDGPHTLESQLKSLELYLPKLKKNGLFVIEDVQSEKWFDQLIEKSEKVCKSIDNDFEYVVECIDLRDKKGRWDDLIFLVRS